MTNFLSDNETDLVIDLAKEKGLKEHPSKEQNVMLADKMTQRTFDAWDVNFDGKISVEEVIKYSVLIPLIILFAVFFMSILNVNSCYNLFLDRRDVDSGQFIA